MDLEKKYVYKFVKKDGGAWGFGEGRQGKDYNFANPYTWAGPPRFGADGEFYINWPLTSRMDVWRPVKK